MQTPLPRPLCTALALAGLCLAPAAAGAAEGKAAPKSRTFLFTYQATVTGLKPGQTARVWVPVPPSDQDQKVEIVKRDLPAEGEIGKDPVYGNRILYVQAKANDEGRVPLALTYRVTRKEVRADLEARDDHKEDLDLFLKANAKVPINGKPLTLLQGHELPDDQTKAARVLYDIVNRHMRYSKEGTGWGQGDSNWACDSGYGNCTDFHSLFMSLARSQKIPVKFVIGFPLPEKPGEGDVPGYHCWAWFKPAGRAWVPVDISEANKDPKRKDYYFGNLTENRVAFSTGRDLTLVPKQDGPPLNYFIYPYVEVDGKPYDKVERKFHFQDVAAGEK